MMEESANAISNPSPLQVELDTPSSVDTREAAPDSRVGRVHREESGRRDDVPRQPRRTGGGAGLGTAPGQEAQHAGIPYGKMGLPKG